MGPEREKEVHQELKLVLAECYEIGYTAGYFRNDFANSNPAELCMRYTMNPPTSGLFELQQRKRLDLAVENVVWNFGSDFPKPVVVQARDRLKEFGFDVRTQKPISPHSVSGRMARRSGRPPSADADRCSVGFANLCDGMDRRRMKRETPDDSDAERLQRVVSALVSGNADIAEHELGPVAGQTIVSHPIQPLPKSADPERLPTTGAKTRSPGKLAMARVFLGDRFLCVYCGRKTICLEVMKLISLRFPVEFPRQRNWRKAECHRAYSDISASLDHVEPVSGGGDWQASANLATACYRCQQQKGNLMGWGRIDVEPSAWRGLTEDYEALWDLMGRPGGGHAAWISAFSTAHTTVG